jgi:tetratricopeptide (TPR) repeat protein
MRNELSRTRRLLVAFVALVASGVLFRPQVADALIVRGDDYIYRGDANAALERYRRALALWPVSETAADRYVFLEMQRNTPEALRSGVQIATRYLARRPHSSVVLFDRALCFLRAKRYALAQRDFVRAADASGSAQALVFAGWAAEHRGDRPAARRLWLRALRAQPRYKPALVALAEHAR